ncbi:7138_t:CDS:2 [Dentiscutata erythropus]|uniref:7138_t:CDS:1 n=1 Tax=Dentiscutata erythropus TaxID=1348616 RepID=A0A9N9HPU5_9GLOM|nr:7138_t:CDS:2 [Dentiscutata erythropus]
MKLFYLISSLFTIIITFTWANAQQLCNGHAELCNKSYSAVSFVATHNSYAYGNLVAATQDYSIPTQLKDGVRGFLLSALASPNPSSTDIELCHTSCSLLDAGTVVNTLKNFTTFLQNNPNEVITLFWRNDFSNLTATDFKTAFDKAGLTQYCFTQPLGSAWPTMSDIISSGKRVMNFLDSGADTTTVPWLMAEYSYVFETPYDNTDPNAVWPCTIDRPKGQSRPLYMINHFLYTEIASSSIEVEIPSRSIVNSTNSLSLQTQAQNCTKIFGKAPNFIAVDFYDQGSKDLNVFSVIANYNGVPYTPTTYGDGSINNKVSSKANSIKINFSTAIVSLLIIFIFAVVEL